MNRREPFVALVAVVVLASILLSASLAWSETLKPWTIDAIGTGLILALVLWMDLDARRRRIVPCHDFGFLTMVVFPASLVWYVFWSRGWRGVFLLAGLLGLWAVPFLSAVATAILVRR
ncbi:MAG: hypothetical protein ABS79_02220 [Planctomycetes bacterium SCN 63-9]|nr:MAG: hypothetical protein ABS79_02220 [Planctomycetes bacterium SCN 63-9]